MSTLHTQPGIGGFSSLLKVTRQQVFFISAGIEFHSRGPATENILSRIGCEMAARRSHCKVAPVDVVHETPEAGLSTALVVSPEPSVVS